MRIVIAAVGRLKQGPERELAAAYRKRAEATGRALGLREIEIVEIRESRAQDVERRRVEESIAIANVIPDGAVVVILDERGENLDSAALAAALRAWRAEDRAAACFIIGGADGLAPSLLERRQAQARVRRRHLAASARPHHAARTALSRRHHPFRASLSPGLKQDSRCRRLPIRASLICDEIGAGRVLIRTHRGCLCLAFQKLASTLGQHDSPLEPHRSAPCARIGVGVCAAAGRRPALARRPNPPGQTPRRCQRARPHSSAGNPTPASRRRKPMPTRSSSAIRSSTRSARRSASRRKARRSSSARSKRWARTVARSTSS